MGTAADTIGIVELSNVSDGPPAHDRYFKLPGRQREDILERVGSQCCSKTEPKRVEHAGSVSDQDRLASVTLS